MKLTRKRRCNHSVKPNCAKCGTVCKRVRYSYSGESLCNKCGLSNARMLTRKLKENKELQKVIKLYPFLKKYLNLNFVMG